MNVKMFDMCKFNGFYKKAHDGRFIYLNKKELTADLCDSNKWDENDGIVESNCERAEKIYYKYVSSNGKGVVVGFIDLVISGYLDVIYEDECDVGYGVIPSAFYVTKTANEIIKCAIVYYSNNKKHYVPLCDVEKLVEQ